MRIIDLFCRNAVVFDGGDVSQPWTDAEIAYARQRMREADQGIGVFDIEEYRKGMDQLDDYMLQRNPNWRPWGTRSIQKGD